MSFCTDSELFLTFYYVNVPTVIHSYLGSYSIIYMLFDLVGKSSAGRNFDIVF